MNPEQNKIMVQVWNVIFTALSRDFKTMHIKRDAYLNSLLAREIENLAREVKTPNSDAVYQRLVDRRFPVAEKKPLTLELDQALIARMRVVLQEKRIPRDSFINRVIFFLLARDEHLKELGIDYERTWRIEGKPLNDAWGFLSDPFFAIRAANMDQFYTLACFEDGPFGPNGPNLFSLNTAISEEDWAAVNIPQDNLVATFGLTPDQEN